ncbi:MAG: hypothetical protein FWD32_03050, partial [Firmicutes bacterium]|nr:hypothetical protein [Bacillota bacterium]
MINKIRKSIVILPMVLIMAICGLIGGGFAINSARLGNSPISTQASDFSAITADNSVVALVSTTSVTRGQNVVVEVHLRNFKSALAAFNLSLAFDANRFEVLPDGPPQFGIATGWGADLKMLADFSMAQLGQNGVAAANTLGQVRITALASNPDAWLIG